METSEKQVIEELLNNGEVPTEIAEQLLTIADSQSRNIVSPSKADFTAVALLVDKSGSMEKLVDAVIEGQAHMFYALKDADPSLDILIGQTLFDHNINKFQECVKFRASSGQIDLSSMNKSITFSISPEVKLLSKDNYKPGGFTALYDAILSGISLLLPIRKMADEEGNQLSSTVCILTDGRDEGPNGKPGSKIKPENLKKVVEFVLENNFISDIILAGIGDYDFKRIGNEIGIQNVVNVQNDAKSIRSAFGLFSSFTLQSIKK